MTDSLVSHLGGALRERRRELNLTQDELADLSGVSVRFVRNLEHDAGGVRTDKLFAVLDTLGLVFRVERRDQLVAGGRP